jgi:hypothetical protein
MNEFKEHPLTHAAFLYAKAEHERVGQMRKFGPVQRPYIVHPVQVATYVQGTIHNDPVNVAVALLHDVLEDTLYEGETTEQGAERLLQYFTLLPPGDKGELPWTLVDAAALVTGVLEVTDVAVPEDGVRKVRMAINCDHAAKAAPPRQTVKLCDIKSNMPSIVLHNRGFAHKWVPEKKNVWLRMTKGDPKMHAEVGHMIDMFEKGLFNANNYEIV